MDLQEAFDAGFEAVRAYVDQSFEAFEKRILAMEKRIAEPAVDKDDLQAVQSDISALRAAATDAKDIGKGIGALQASIDAMPRFDAQKAMGELEAKCAVMLDERVQRAVAALPVGKDGKDGKDGCDGVPGIPDPFMIKQMVTEAVMALPPAQNGKDADPALVASLVKSEAERILAGWERPQDGKSVTAEELTPLIEDRVQKAIAAIPVPKDGRDGVSLAGAVIDRTGNLILTLSDGTTRELGHVVGKDVDMVAVKSMVDEAAHKAITEAVAALPKPKDGAPGQKGEPGLDGTPGRDGKDGLAGIDGKDGAPGRDGKDAEPITKELIIEAIRSTDAIPVAVQHYLEANPPLAGKDGKDGVDGHDGAPGKDGRDGVDGQKGLDGKDGRDGADGVNGKDGIGIDDIEMSLEDDGRVLVAKFLREGAMIKDFRLKTKTAIWRGPFDRGREYEPGDMATWNGSVWHCNLPSKGEIGSNAWGLAVKKGRDGKE